MLHMLIKSMFDARVSRRSPNFENFIITYKFTVTPNRYTHKIKSSSIFILINSSGFYSFNSSKLIKHSKLYKLEQTFKPNEQ